MNGLVKQKTTSGAKKVEEKPDLIDKNALIHQMNRTSHLNNDAMQDEGQLILARMKAAMALKFAKKNESANKTE